MIIFLFNFFWKFKSSSISFDTFDSFSRRDSERVCWYSFCYHVKWLFLEVVHVAVGYIICIPLLFPSIGQLLGDGWHRSLWALYWDTLWQDWQSWSCSTGQQWWSYLYRDMESCLHSGMSFSWIKEEQRYCSVDHWLGCIFLFRLSCGYCNFITWEKLLHIFFCVIIDKFVTCFKC